MAVRDVQLKIDGYERGAPYTVVVAGQHNLLVFKDLYESLLMTGGVSPAVFSGQASEYKPSFYLLPDPINVLIPSFDVGLRKRDTSLAEFQVATSYPDPSLIFHNYQGSPAEVGAVYVNATVLPDIYWRLVTQRLLAPNEPFCFFLVLSPAVKDDIALPWAKVTWGQGEWELLFRPELRPVIRFRGQPVTTVAGIAGDMWVTSSLWKFEGMVSAIAVLPVRGHLVVANARDWNPLRPDITAVNPYILGKSGDEPIWRSGPIVIEGQGVAAFVGIPSLDFSTQGAIKLPPIPVLEPIEGDPASLGGSFSLNHSTTVTVVPLMKGAVASPVQRATATLSARVYGTGRPFAILDFTAVGMARQEGAHLTHIMYQLSYNNQPHSFFELVAVDFFIPPEVGAVRRRVGNLTDLFAVEEVVVRLSESGMDADVTLYPRVPLQTLPVIDTDYYVEVWVRYQNLKGKKQELVIKGFIKEVGQEQREGVWGNIAWKLRVVDVGQRLREVRGDGLFPVFDGWSVREVFEYCLLKAGLHPDEFLHFYGNDFVLEPQLLWHQPSPPELPPPLLPEPPIAGFPYWWAIEKPRFTIGVGQTLWDFLNNLALMTGNEIIVDGLGVWVIPSAYESPVSTHNIVDLSDEGATDVSQVLSDPDTYGAAELRLRGTPGWMPTTYLAIGKHPLGFPIYSFWELPHLIRDPSAPNFRGFRVTRTIADQKLATPWLAFRRAFYEYLATFRAIPLTIDLRLFDIPANPYLGLRDRVTVQSKATVDVWLSQHGVKPYPAGPQEFVVRQVLWRFHADPAQCVTELSVSPPANIPYGLILPRPTG